MELATVHVDMYIYRYTNSSGRSFEQSARHHRDISIFPSRDVTLTRREPPFFLHFRPFPHVLSVDTYVKSTSTRSPRNISPFSNKNRQCAVLAVHISRSLVKILLVEILHREHAFGKRALCLRPHQIEPSIIPIDVVAHQHSGKSGRAETQ